MSNEFIEDLRKTTKPSSEQEYKDQLKQQHPWLTQEGLDEAAFEDHLKRMFNPKEGEER